MEDKKIMIVETNKDTGTLTQIYVESMGITKENIRLVKSGFEAIELTKKEVFDIIIMDIQMPHLDGIETSKIIKPSGHDGSIPQIIAHTTMPVYPQEEIYT